MTQLEQQLTSFLDTKPSIVGIGNSLRKDDGVGVLIAGSLSERANKAGFNVFNAEDVIESYLSDITNADSENVLIIDAVAADLEPGDIIFGSFDEINTDKTALSTHKLSIELSIKIMKQRGKTPYLLGIQPSDTQYGFGLTTPVAKSADYIISCFTNSFKNQEIGE